MKTKARNKQTGATRVRFAAAAAQEQLLNTVHQVWLAGLGAFYKAQTGAPKMFDELVKEGARVHARGGKTVDKALRDMVTRARTAFETRTNDVREKATDTLENLEKMFQARVQRTLHQLGVPGAREIDRLTARIDLLNANVEKLARRRAAVAKAGGDGKRAVAPPPAAH